MKMVKFRCRIENQILKFKFQERCLDSTFIFVWVLLVYMWKLWIWEERGEKGRVEKEREKVERRGEFNDSFFNE